MGKCSLYNKWEKICRTGCTVDVTHVNKKAYCICMYMCISTETCLEENIPKYVKYCRFTENFTFFSVLLHFCTELKEKKTLHLKHYSGRDFTTKNKVYIISKNREAELANLDNLALKIYSKLMSRTSYVLKFLLGLNDPLIQLE